MISSASTTGQAGLPANGPVFLGSASLAKSAYCALPAVTLLRFMKLINKFTETDAKLLLGTKVSTLAIPRKQVW